MKMKKKNPAQVGQLTGHAGHAQLSWSSMAQAQEKNKKKATTTTMMMLFRLVAGLGQDLVGIEESSWCGHTHIAIAI